MNDTLMSIIVPVYKVEKYVSKCIDSLICQTFNNIEIILVDDGSPDASGQICDDYAKLDSRINVIHINNSGVSVARNTGINAASGEWITFVDGDDWVAPDFCEKIISQIDKTDYDVLIFSYYTAYPDKNINSKLIQLTDGDVSEYKSYIQAKMISQYYDNKVFNNGVSAGTCWCKVIRNAILSENNLRFVPELTRAQDTVFWINAFDHVNKIKYYDTPLYYYRMNDTSIVSGRKYIPDSKKVFGKLLNEYEKFIEGHSDKSGFEEAFYSRCIQVLTWHMKHNFINASNKNEKSKIVSDLKGLCLSEPYKKSIKNVNTKYLPKRLRILVYLLRIHAYQLSIIFCRKLYL